MGKTIPIDQLPREAERLLRAAWEEQESVVLERDGEPVAAVVPMDEYRRMQIGSAEARSKPGTPEQGAGPVDIRPALAVPPAELLTAGLVESYQRLVSKKLTEGLPPEEEAELERLGAELDAADAVTPAERDADARARREHDRRISVLTDILGKLRSLQAPR
jgi:prevent-host-death family protein